MVGRMFLGIDAGMDDPDAVSGNSPAHQVGPGAFADGMKRGSLVGSRNRTLRQPDEACRRYGRFVKDRAAEEMRNDDVERSPGESRNEQRQLVDVLDQDIGRTFSE